MFEAEKYFSFVKKGNVLNIFEKKSLSFLELVSHNYFEFSLEESNATILVSQS